MPGLAPSSLRPGCGGAQPPPLPPLPCVARPAHQGPAPGDGTSGRSRPSLFGSAPAAAAEPWGHGPGRPALAPLGAFMESRAGKLSSPEGFFSGTAWAALGSTGRRSWLGGPRAEDRPRERLWLRGRGRGAERRALLAPPARSTVVGREPGTSRERPGWYALRSVSPPLCCCKWNCFFNFIFRWFIRLQGFRLHFLTCNFIFFLLC